MENTNDKYVSIIESILNHKDNKILATENKESTTVEVTDKVYYPNANSSYSKPSIFSISAYLDPSKIGQGTTKSEVSFIDGDLMDSFYEIRDDESLGDYNARITNQLYDSYINAGYSDEQAHGILDNLTSSLNSGVNNLSGYLGNKADSWGESLASVDGAAGELLSPILSGVGAMINNLGDYEDGVSETLFGAKQESTWRSFVSYISKGGSYNINVVKNTPLNSEEGSLYGTMMLGAPPSFTSLADPRKATMINTIVKDAKFISLTPGLPKYAGVDGFNEITRELTNGDNMMEFLLKNGIDSSNMAKDKRYYTFEAQFSKYYAHLETLLNAIWIKMGLATEDSNTFNLMTFFNGFQTNENADPLSQYQSGIGLFVNVNGSVTESISNEKTSFGSGISGDINSEADQYSRINYTTGMGTGNSTQNVGRKVAMGAQGAITGRNTLADKFTNMKLLGNKATGWGKYVAMAAGAALDVALFAASDIGTTTQKFAVSNGMKVTYPELWSDSSYSKSMTFDFNFQATTGDPLSIFKDVIVPFAALLAMALPRQADYNGLVSPFFVRADLPGIISSDFALISSVSFTRGGAQSLFTKDGYPLAISGSFTIDDLYPYLSMTKRISFLSTNPSYVSFIDSMVGINAKYDDESSANLNDYWRLMLNRANGNYGSIGLWNTFSDTEREANVDFINTKSKNKYTADSKIINWMRRT